MENDNILIRNVHDRKWHSMWQAYMDFMNANKRRPSKYYPDERTLYNWYKHCRKQINKGEMPQERMRAFRELINVAMKYHRLNQYSYAAGNRLQESIDKENNAVPGSLFG